MRRAAVILAASLCIAPAARGAETAVPVRTESHPGFGRIAFDFSAPVRFSIERAGDRVAVLFTSTRAVGRAPTLPRNVTAVAGGPGRAEITVATGARIRAGRAANRILIDVLDPAPGAAPGAAPTAPPAGKSEPAPHASPPASAAAPAPAAPASAPQSSVSPHAAAPAGPVSLSAQVSPTADGWSFTVPFEAEVGAAAFRLGDAGVVVFDQPRPIDLASLRGSAALAGASVQLLPGATVLRIPLPAGTALFLTREPDHWTIAPARAEPQAMAIRVADRTLVLAAGKPGRVVTMVDPATGLDLLVGTQRGGPGQGVLGVRHAPEFDLAATWQGVVIEPLSDGLVLRAREDGFVLSAEPDGLAVSLPDGPDALAPAAGMTRRFDFPPLADAALEERLRAQVAAASARPPLARGRPRRQAAQTMIALGLGAEAAALMRLAALDDAREAENPDAGALFAIASVLAGRPQDAAGLIDKRLDGTDEIAFWRAVRTAARAEDGLPPEEGASPPAATFAATVPLVLSYPAALRARLLPLIAETLAGGGEEKAAAALLAERRDDPALGLARAMLAEANHDTEAALSQYDALAAGRDRLIRVRAALRAIDLRIASGKLGPAEAASALERLLPAWRGDARALAIRLKLASLRAEAGAYRPALALLRETEAEMPDQIPAIRAAMQSAFATLLRDGNAERVAPLDLVSLAEENSDLVPEGDAGAALATALADRLTALDLPARIGPLLEHLMRRAPAGPARASVGARLASLRLGENDAAGAVAALAASDAAELPPALAESRVLLGARAAAAQGREADALAALASLDMPAAIDARATILETAKDWPQAEQAVAALVAKTLPPDGRLDDVQRRLLLRLASAAAQAGDTGALAALREREFARMQGGPVGDMFRLLTADPVRGVADLARARQDVALARSLPGDLQALGASH